MSNILFIYIRRIVYDIYIDLVREYSACIAYLVTKRKSSLGQCPHALCPDERQCSYANISMARPRVRYLRTEPHSIGGMPICVPHNRDYYMLFDCDTAY